MPASFARTLWLLLSICSSCFLFCSLLLQVREIIKFRPPPAKRGCGHVSPRARNRSGHTLSKCPPSARPEPRGGKTGDLRDTHAERERARTLSGRATYMCKRNVTCANVTTFLTTRGTSASLRIPAVWSTAMTPHRPHSCTQTRPGT